MAVLYLITLTEIKNMNTKINCCDYQVFEAVPPHTPLHLIDLSTVYFVHSVFEHKKRITHTLSEQELQIVIEQHAQLVKVVAHSPGLKATLLADSR